MLTKDIISLEQLGPDAGTERKVLDVTYEPS